MLLRNASQQPGMRGAVNNRPPAATLSSYTVNENTAAGTLVAAISGQAGSVFTLFDSDGGRFALAGTSLNTGATSIDYEAGTIRTVAVDETNGGWPAPRRNYWQITVLNQFEAANLSAIGMSATTLYTGVPANGTLTGVTAGQTLNVAGVPAGLTINTVANTWAWDGTGAVSTPSVTFTGTLADSANSPLVNAVALSIANVPPLPLKIVAEGDSITAAGSSYSDQWAAANPGVPYQKFAVSGAKITNNGGNSLTARAAAVIAAAPSIVTVFIGANDIHTVGAATWLTQLWAYCDTLKVGRPGVKILVILVVPATAAIRPGLNAERAIANAALRAAVGNQIDGIIPFGENPVYGTDAAASDVSLYPDGLHPSALVHGYMKDTYSDVLSGIVSGASGANPTPFVFSDVVNAPVSSSQTTRTRVSGMGMGATAVASIAGVGTFAQGIAVQGTAAATVVNGDVLTSVVQASAANSTAVSQVLTVGAVSDTWTVTTVAAPAVPVLTAPSGVSTGATTANISVTTDQGSGTMYSYLSASATQPSIADLKAGTGAVVSGSAAVTAPGAVNGGISGLTPSTTYYAHFVQNNASGDSAIITSASFTTSAVASDQFVRLATRGANLVETVNGSGYDYHATVAGYLAASGAATGSSSVKIPAGQDGWFVYKLSNASDTQGPIIALKTSAALSGFNQYTYALYRENLLTTAYKCVTAGVGNGVVDTAIAPAANDWVRLRRSGTTIIGEISKDGGATYSPTKTWTGASTADLYLHIMPGAVTASVVTTPKASSNVA